VPVSGILLIRIGRFRQILNEYGTEFTHLESSTMDRENVKVFPSAYLSKAGKADTGARWGGLLG